MTEYAYSSEWIYIVQGFTDKLNNSSWCVKAFDHEIDAIKYKDELRFEMGETETKITKMKHMDKTRFQDFEYVNYKVITIELVKRMDLNE